MEKNRIDNLINKLTLDEKIALVSGTNFMETNPIPRLNIPSIVMADGPHGLRKQKKEQNNGSTLSEPATCFPTAASLASSFNPDILYKMGKALSKECQYYGVDILLGPGVNIKRNPLCGRNFEYYSEDPFLAGTMGTSLVKGLEENGTMVSVKHFALNNSENYRFLGNSICDGRAMYDLYLKPFEIIVKNAHPSTLMCAYNQINGTFCSENKWLLSDILRKKWGFNGLVMTDWGATHDRVKGIKAGLDLEMPGGTLICRKMIKDGITSGILQIEDLDKAVKNVLTIVKRAIQNKPENKDVDFKAHHALARKIAAESAVLLKNDNVLPLNKKGNYLVIGELFSKMRYQGSGSSMINPTFLVSPKEAFDTHCLKYDYLKGYSLSSDNYNSNLLKGINLSSYDKIILFIGLSDDAESEGGDRNSFLLPTNQLKVIEQLKNLSIPIVGVLFGGSPFEISFLNQFQGLINMYLPGQNGGNACFDLLFGDANPSGRLAETWPASYQDILSSNTFGKDVNEIYQESIYVGYRYFNEIHPPLFDFGYGLSYTTFEYSNYSVELFNDLIKIDVDITNIGNRYGKEVVQIYVENPNSLTYRPIRELKVFTKVGLEVNETKHVSLVIKVDDLKYYEPSLNDFLLEPGKYYLSLCKSANQVIMKKEINILGSFPNNILDGDLLKLYRDFMISKVSNNLYLTTFKLDYPVKQKKPITLESRFTDLNYTFFGRILYKMIMRIPKKELKKALKLPESKEKDNLVKGALFLIRIFESNSIISMSMSGGNRFPYNFAKGIVEVSNGHLFKGLYQFTHKIKASKLPKDE